MIPWLIFIFCSCLSRSQLKRMCASSSSEDLLFHDALCIFYVYFVASYLKCKIY